MKQKQDFNYSDKISTQITLEEPSDHSSYAVKERYIYGYSHSELLEKKSFIDTLFLLFAGELPSSEQKSILDMLALALCNPGPRHEATRSSMIAGVSKTSTGNLLPLAASVLSGEQGSKEVEKACEFMSENVSVSPMEKELLSNRIQCEFLLTTAPGFTNEYDSIPILPEQFAQQILHKHPQCVFLQWACDFSSAQKELGTGLNIQGLAAAVLLDLGIAAREASVLYQWLCLPGILAHGLEQTHKPITAIPFLNDENYHFNRDE